MFDAIDVLRQGGWPMIPLAFCSLAAVTIIIERLVALRRGRVLQAGVVDALRSYAGEDSVKPTLDVCMQSGGAFARIIEELLGARHLDHVHVIETVHVTGRREVGRLERGLIVLEIIAGISPLIGLLGTVLGMVTVFDAITAEGIGDPQVLSDGISKALITTVAGLCVAIPSLAFHSYLSNLVESMAIEMEELATGFSARMRAFPQ
ncbi:MAG: MotA/TolQ/ExbB proton channel family protein [Candidatus Hydrogenedentes bacterium]|nr:MotA/TolQ/ExbB proton channel family protein [Candidatus Hydrogenedentota bacterium]